jgi:RHS repeat-associated protein
VTRSGKLTVAGTTTTNATSVTVNGVAASRYGDTTFAKDGFTLTNGVNSFTAVAQDALGRLDTNMVTVNLPATVSFTYDDNGNLLNDGRRLLGYDDENQLTSVIVTNGVNNSTLSKFAYDGFGRRRVRTECVWQNGGWATNALVRYVYDGMVVLQERDGNNLPTVTYTRGRDLSGSLQGAGGIGGLLSRTDQTTPTWSHAYYQADGNGNVMCLINEKQAVVARYVYEPFGNVLSMSGPLAEVNLYRFSSKEAHPVSGLVYYRFRFYDPNLQRWVNRDPIGEVGGANLYAYVQGSPLNFADPFGLIPGVPPGAPGNPPVVPRYQTPIEPFPKDGWGQKGWPDGRVGRAWDPNWEGNHLERPEGSHHPRLPPRITPPCGCPPGNCPGHIASTHPEPAARSDAAAPAYPLVWRGPYRGLEQLPMPIPPPKPATNVTRPWGGIIQRNVPPVNLPR